LVAECTVDVVAAAVGWNTAVVAGILHFYHHTEFSDFFEDLRKQMFHLKLTKLNFLTLRNVMFVSTIFTEFTSAFLKKSTDDHFSNLLNT
jgi:hypothetical protein